MSIEQTSNTAAPLKFICPRHPDTELRFVLAGGAGHCEQCGLFVQSSNHPEPQRDIARPSAAALVKAKRAAKAKPKATTKPKKTAKNLAKPSIPSRARDKRIKRQPTAPARIIAA